MRLKVTIRQPQATPAERHVQITADATATAGDVARALTSTGEVTAPGAGADISFRIVGTGHGQAKVLPTAVTLLESGLRSGAVVDLVAAQPLAFEPGSSAPVAVLRVLEGPDVGREVPLSEGESTIGRTIGNVVQLSDPMVSGSHARIRVSDKVEIFDDRSANGVLVGGVMVNRVQLRPGDQATLGASVIQVELLRTDTATSASSTDILYNRSPLVISRPFERKVELPVPPSQPGESRFPLLAMAAPLIMGIVMYAVSRNVLSLAFIALSPILMIGNWVDQRFRTKRQHKLDVASFDADLEFAKRDLQDKADADRVALEVMYPSTAECLRAAAHLGPLLWSRRPEHPEFLRVRLGTGTIPAYTRVDDPKPGGIPEFTARVREVAQSSVELSGAPVDVDLRSVGGLGVAGSRPAIDDLARALVAQVAVLHSPSEVVVTCLTSTIGRSRWSWLEWMPHTASPHSPLPGNHLSADAGTGLLLLSKLEELVEVRSRENRKDHDRGPIHGREDPLAPVVPAVVVIADDPSIERARLIRISERGPDVGVYVVWMAGTVASLPATCRAFVDLNDLGEAWAGLVRRGLRLRGVATEGVDVATALTLARSLSPVLDGGAPVDDDSDLPRGISVVTLLGTEPSDEPEQVLAKWRENRSLIARDGSPPHKLEKPSSLRALVGHAGTEDLVLDLRAHGPHALVGGTTGAGKSEFLQAWVLGMAHAYSPDRVTFLFVDYKGGAAFSACTELPHYVGMVTDLDTNEVRRVLRSLRAELHYRERLLRDKGVKDLLELEMTGDPECPPSLIIVVDEFAALVGEVPEFVDGVVDVAQRGRSLGLHLILATQRPAGVIKDNLRANTNLRVALRMADESDSQDVLGDSMAAHFDSSIPGRGAVKTGPGRITMFQSAYPGARTPAVVPAPPIIATELDFGVGQAWPMPERPHVSDAIPQDIKRVVKTVRRAADMGAVPKPRRPWLDPLGETYNIATLGQQSDSKIVLGVMDDPDRQRQVTEFFRPDEDGNILYVGGGSSGKSTALRSLAVAASITPTGGPVHIYGLDFGGGGLSGLEALPTVGTVVSGDDSERVARLLRMIASIVEERGPRMKAAHAATLAAYRQKPGRSLEPRILLVVDGFASFRADYEGSPQMMALYQLFQRILAEGRGAGVHVAMTADRPSAVPTAIGSAFPRRLALRMADEGSYIAMGVPKDMLKPTSPPGRAVQVDKHNELQIAILGTDGNVAAQAREIEALSVVLRDRVAVSPPQVKSLASSIPAGILPSSVGGRATLGVADDTLEPVGFEASGVLLLAGPAGSGRTNALHWLAQTFQSQPGPRSLVHLSMRRSPLSSLECWMTSSIGLNASNDLIARLKPYAEQPADELPERLGVFIEGYAEFVGTPAESAVLEFVKLCRRNGHFLVAESETTAWSSPWPLIMEIRNARNGILLTPDQVDGDNLLRTSLPRCKRADFPAGRGFYVRGGTALKIQLPLAE